MMKKRKKEGEREREDGIEKERGRKKERMEERKIEGEQERERGCGRIFFLCFKLSLSIHLSCLMLYSFIVLKSFSLLSKCSFSRTYI